MATVYNKSAFELAHARMRLAPIELTETDVEQLAIIDPALETKAHEAKRQAQLAIVQQHTPVQTKAASPVDRSQLPVTRKFLHKNLDAFADHFGTALVDILKPLKGKIVALEAEVAQLNARPLQKWAGIFIGGVQYAEASLVTHGGSLWVATAATTTTPGAPGNDWRLIVKSR